MKTLLIIPAYNEEKNILKVIDMIKEQCPEADYLVVNDCSKDDTQALLKEHGAEYVNCPVNLGIGGAVQTGYRYALENDYDVAIQVDGDGQHDVSFVSKMVKEIEEGRADIVIGKQGRVAKAIRTIVYSAAGGHQKKKTYVDILD